MKYSLRLLIARTLIVFSVIAVSSVAAQSVAFAEDGYSFEYGGLVIN
jgi:hypothetical protein